MVPSSVGCHGSATPPPGPFPDRTSDRLRPTDRTPACLDRVTPVARTNDGSPPRDDRVAAVLVSIVEDGVQGRALAVECAVGEVLGPVERAVREVVVECAVRELLTGTRRRIGTRERLVAGRDRAGEEDHRDRRDDCEYDHDAVRRSDRTGSTETATVYGSSSTAGS